MSGVTNSYYVCDDSMIGARSYFRRKHKNENFPQTRNVDPEETRRVRIKVREMLVKFLNIPEELDRDLFDKSPERDVQIYRNNYSGNWIRRVLGLLELADSDGIGIRATFEIAGASMDQLERLANHIELAETQEFEFIPELEEN